MKRKLNDNEKIPLFGIAPMVNQSELAFRLFVREHSESFLIGSSSSNETFSSLNLSSPLLSWTPMLDVNDLVVEDERVALECLKNSLAFHQKDENCLVQIGGSNLKHIQQSIELIQKTYSNEKFLGYDLNLGCPQPFAKLKNIGAFLALDVDKASACCRVMRDSCDKFGLRLMSTKIRIHTRIDHSMRLVNSLIDNGSQLMSIHGRTWQQNRNGAADWSAVQQLCDVDRVPTFSNGGVRCAADIDRALLATNADGIMSAEPLLVDPHLFRTWALQRRPQHSSTAASTSIDDKHNDNQRCWLQFEKAQSFLETVSLLNSPDSSAEKSRNHVLHMLGLRRRSYQGFSARGSFWQQQFFINNRLKHVRALIFDATTHDQLVHALDLYKQHYEQLETIPTCNDMFCHPPPSENSKIK